MSSFLPEAQIINFPSAVRMMLARRLTCILMLHLVLKLFSPFLFNSGCQILSSYQLLGSRNSPLKEQCRNKINIKSCIFVTRQHDTHYFERHRTRYNCLFALQICIRSISLPTTKCYAKRWCKIKLEQQKRATGVTAFLSTSTVAWLARPKGTCTLLFQPLIPRRATGRKGAAAVNSQTSCFQLKWEMSLTPRSRFRLTCGISRTLGVSEVLYSS